MEAMRVNGVDQFRLARGLVDAEGCDGVFAPGSHLLALHFHQSTGPIAEIGEATVWMNVDRPDHLLGPKVAGLGQCRDGECRPRFQIVTPQPIDLKLVLPLNRNEQPRFCRVEIDVPGTKAVTTTRRDRCDVVHLSVPKALYLDGSR